MKRFLFLILLITNYTYSQVIHKPQHDPPIIINSYSPVLAFDICTNAVTVMDPLLYNVGDTVLLIQMMGAVIDSSNTATFGTVIDYKNAGNYEMNYISSISGNKIGLRNKLTRNYDIPNGKVQLIRVPYYNVTNYYGQYTCLAWDGTIGGVLVLNAKTVDLLDDIVVTGTGFRPGRFVPNLPPNTCAANNYAYPAAFNGAAFKGDGIAGISQNIIKGKGKMANGGGGGLSNNSGGGGGGNGGMGGFGGYQSDTCGSAPFDNRGIGGNSLSYSTSLNKIFMGGGGGIGHKERQDFSTFFGDGAGGGIVIIIANSLTSSGSHIISNGADASQCSGPFCNDGMNGGGAGGTVLLYVNQITDNLIVETKGGNGADMNSLLSQGGRVGPGGGGGGGVLFLKQSAMPGLVTSLNTAGMNGVITADANNPWGATQGTDGTNLFDLPDPFDTVLFKPNIDSVRIKDSVMSCNFINLKGFGYTNSFAISFWQWDFGDGFTANTQNTSHNYGAIGTYPVKLIVTDINGCKDSIIKNVTTNGIMLADAGSDTSVCSSGQVAVTLNGNGTGTYSWTPAIYLNNSMLQNPVATIASTTKFYLTVSNGIGCAAIDSVIITTKPKPIVKTLNDTTICKNANLVLTTTGASTYSWSPAAFVSDPNIASPLFIGTTSQTLMVTGTIANGCSQNDTIFVNVKLPPLFFAPPDKSFCFNGSVMLDGRNGNAYQYLWSPATYLSNPNISNPVANPPFTMVYSVTITDNICSYDSSFFVNVTVLPSPTLNATKSNDINCNLPFAHLNASGALQYTWSPPIFLSNSVIANPVANPTMTTKYVVTGTDNNGCSNKDSIDLIVNFGNYGFELPNSFTPNGDGINDCFGIRYYRDVENLIFTIYNRYGTKVFETKNAALCWDGDYKGQPADPGSYIYYLSATTLCGKVIKKGSLLLLR